MMRHTLVCANLPEWESSGRCEFDVGIRVRPEKRNAGEPVFRVDGLADARGILSWEDASGSQEFGAGDSSAHGARGDFDLRVVADALDLAHLACSHEIELVAFFGEPNRGVDRDSGFAKGGKREVALSVDLGGDGHGDILNNVLTKGHRRSYNSAARRRWS